MKELLARVRAVTRRKSEITDSILTVGNLTLNRNTFELSTGDKSIRLVGKEFQIIEMMMINAGNVISSERILDKVCNDLYFLYSRSFSTYISILYFFWRRK